MKGLTVWWTEIDVYICRKLSKNKKISDKEFLAILRENAALFSRTCRAIKKQFGIEYTRQAVRARALKHPEELQDIEEENIDVAEEGLHSLMRSKNERMRFLAIDLYLKTKGKKRGYTIKQEIEINTKSDVQQMLENLDQ